MRAVILAGGLGTRLRPYTTVLPKPLVPVGDRPILERILYQLAGYGITRVDLCIAHLGDLIRVYFSESHAAPEAVELHWHWEDTPLGTAGALQLVPDLKGTFIAMNGDVLTNIDYNALVEYHHQREATLTIAMYRKKVQIELGVMDTADGYVSGYREKPTLAYDVSMGVYVYDARALSFLPEGACQFPELVQRLLEAGERVAAFPCYDAEWFDVGTFGEMERASAMLEQHPRLFDPPETNRAGPDR
jgi:NDP-sugar pyrophosphorylase family protein